MHVMKLQSVGVFIDNTKLSFYPPPPFFLTNGSESSTFFGVRFLSFFLYTVLHDV